MHENSLVPGLIIPFSFTLTACAYFMWVDRNIYIETLSQDLSCGSFRKTLRLSMINLLMLKQEDAAPLFFFSKKQLHIHPNVLNPYPFERHTRPSG